MEKHIFEVRNKSGNVVCEIYYSGKTPDCPVITSRLLREAVQKRITTFGANPKKLVGAVIKRIK